MNHSEILDAVVVTDGVERRLATSWSKSTWLCLEDDTWLPKDKWWIVHARKVVEKIVTNTKKPDTQEPIVHTDKSQDKHIEALRELLKTRSDVGLKKYGVTLERNDLKPSEWAQHLLEELLDAAGYIHRLKEDLEAIERFGKP